MRRDHQIPPLGIVNPDYDFDAGVLLLTYCIGDDDDPDEVIDVHARGGFRVDAALRDEIRAIALTGISAGDVETQETRIPPQGTDLAAMFETWLTEPLTLNVAGSVIGGVILNGCAKLWQKHRRPAPPQQAPQTKPSISPEELFGKHAGGTVAQHYTTHETLTEVNLAITHTHSPYEHSGSVDLCERDGRTFHVDISSPVDGWRVTHIIRQRPTPTADHEDRSDTSRQQAEDEATATSRDD